MKRLQEQSRRLLERYVDGLHQALRQVPSEDRIEVERDVRAHVEAALEDASEPVGPGTMYSVLQTLGRPEQWAPYSGYGDVAVADALPMDPGGAGASRRHLDFGRPIAEEWRLAYLSLFLLVLAFALPPFLWVGVFAAFLTGRAALCASRNEHSPGLLAMPSLLCLYLPAIAILLLLPAISVRLMADRIVDHAAMGQPVAASLLQVAERIAEIRLSNFDPVSTARAALRSGHYLTAPVGIWMTMLGILALCFRRTTARLLRPLLDRHPVGLARSLILAGILLWLCAMLQAAMKQLG